MANLKYKDIKCVDVTKNEQICEWTETIYFVSDGGKIRTFIEHERRIEEINLNNHSHGYSSRERSVQVYDLSEIHLTPERLKKINESELGKLLNEQS